MGKKAKEHRKKVAKRNEKIKLERKGQEKVAMNFLKKLIQKEKERGAFNSPVQSLPSVELPSSNPDTFMGPQI
jgi:hypothetical protein